MKPRPNMQRWAEQTYGPNWRALGVEPMEGWVEQVYGPNWRNQLKSRPKARRVVLHVEDVMPDCRAWFLKHVPGDGWKDRVVVYTLPKTNPMLTARMRLQQRAWDLCSVCNVPVFDNEWVMTAGKPRHPGCQPEPYPKRDTRRRAVAA